jgi:pantoate--beta-alanine ligase
MHLRQISQLTEMNEYSREAKSRGENIALVPTMGALHRGHLSLIEKAAQCAPRVVVSIYVNPTQFAPHEDFSAYPRPLLDDLTLLALYPVAVVFLPGDNHLYPPDFQTYVSNNKLARGFCGASRPQFFQGVCTIVLKLINIVNPDFIVFGRKDYQQYKVVEKMAADLHLSTTVIGAPLLRDHDGMALSSRNVYLTSSERQEARAISQGLFAAAALYQQGERRSHTLLEAARAQIKQHPQLVVEYLSLCHRDTLEECGELVAAPAILLCAVHQGNVRLIDNIELG